MLDALTLTVSVAALLLAAWCGFAAFRDQSTKDWHFIGMAVVSVLALVQLVVGVVKLAGGEKPDEGTVIFVAYLLGAVSTIPAAGFMSLTERTRWGSAIVAAGGVILAVLEVRLYDIWGGISV
jgi:membrane protein DedA with SNARE-associated domain